MVKDIIKIVGEGLKGKTIGQGSISKQESKCTLEFGTFSLLHNIYICTKVVLG